MATPTKKKNRRPLPDRRRWHFKKEISVDNLIAFAMAFTALAAMYNKFDIRISQLETLSVLQKSVDQRQDDAAVRAQARTDLQFTSINGKLDRLIERDMRSK